MKSLGIAAAVLIAVAPTLSNAKKYFLTYDSFYDDGSTPLAEVTCSQGLIDQGYTTFASLPSYPYIGTAPQISASLSYCNSCWEITYTHSHGTSKSVNFTAIDTGVDGPQIYTISVAGMNHITHTVGETGQVVRISVVQQSSEACGLS